ncbi:NifU family protein [Vitellibacter sp. q18]|jgi:Fe-S cluster biogenesis protein NfuA|nr:NifU family protein [Aequorivita lutea]
MGQFNIEIFQTSNQNIVKFIANSFLTGPSSYEFQNIDEAKNSPLAQQLFYLPFVKTVYVSQNFIAIEKYDIVDWPDVQEEVAASITDYLNAGKPVITEADAPRQTPISIYAESTPNPSAMKFIANRPLADGTFEFKGILETENAPLARALFDFPFVKEVFIGPNFVSVMVNNLVEWQEIAMEIREFIRDFIAKGNPVIYQSTPENSASEPNNKMAQSFINHPKNLSALEKEIVSILEEYVIPAVANDGGHIQFNSYAEDTKTVHVILQGACSGCPSATLTLKNGIETILKEMLRGKVEQVVAVNG